MYQADIANTNVTTENKTVVAGRARAYGVVLNTTGASGDFHLKDGGSSGTVKFKYKTTGTATSGLIFGGSEPPNTGKTEEFDGTNWTESGDLNSARGELGGTGTQTAALA